MMYQLYEHQFKRLPSGAVCINGPYETYGLIIKKQDKGTFLIRGTGHKERLTYP